jgi:predicted nuclease of restriction endonuclease-like RecB superfamily
VLTVDMVRAYPRGGQLHLRALKPAERVRAVALAGQYLALARACVGHTRGELEEAFQVVPFAARERKIALGLRKLVVDRCDFEVEEEHDPVALRQAVFGRASALRRALAPGEELDRDAVLAAIAAERDTTPDALERLLYVDLRGAHRLLGFRGISDTELVDAYETGQAQAVLLRAVQVRAHVSSREPATYRALFHKLKFLRLLYRLSPADGDGGAGPGRGDGGQRGSQAGDQANFQAGYQIDIDGPYSLFRSVTKYGLQLALLLPAIQACERWSIAAEVMWGAQRKPLSFALSGEAPRPALADAQALADDVAALVARFAERDSPWQPAPTSDILDLPGVGLCVPDLVFTHRDSGARAYLEVLGFWSRDAVWRRVELVERGLPHRILFAVSDRLRVSEAVLGDDVPGALYVYKGVLSARAVEERLDRLVARPGA